MSFKKIALIALASVALTQTALAEEIRIPPRYIVIEGMKAEHEMNPSLNPDFQYAEARPDIEYYLHRQYENQNVAPEWTPSEEDVNALAKMAWGEARGCGADGIRAVMECAIQRLDSGKYGDTVLAVVSAKGQFYGYKAGNPVTDEIKAIAEDVLKRHHAGEPTKLPEGYYWFTGNGKINIFRNERGKKWTV